LRTRPFSDKRKGALVYAGIVLFATLANADDWVETAGTDESK